MQTLRNWRTESRGPAYIKLGRSVRYTMNDLKEFVDEHRVNHAA